VDSRLIDYTRETILAVWRWHYRISRWAYLALLLSAGAAFWLVPEQRLRWPEAFTALIALLAIIGLVRWRIESHPPPVVTIPLFAAPRKNDRDVAAEVQRIIVTTLRDNLGRRFPWRILPIAETVGSSDDRLARKVRARLRSLYLLYGDIRIDPSGARYVYGRLLIPSERTLQHWDTFTGDSIPERGVLKQLVFRLSPSTQVDNVEYPFELATEVQAVVLGVQAQTMRLLGLTGQAVQTFRDALSHAPKSESHAIDSIRLAFAKFLFAEGRETEALDLLRERAQSATSSPELLRELANHLVIRATRVRSGDLREPIALLRRAAEATGDPHRDTTIYNLANQLNQHRSTQTEGRALFELLVSMGGSYAKRWYVQRIMGVKYWEEGQELYAVGQDEVARRSMRMSAKWYGRAIRSRPRFRLERRGIRPWHVRVRGIPRVPRMYANTADAHQRSGHRLRTVWYRWRTLRLKTAAFERAMSAFLAGREEEAHQWFTYVPTGPPDELELVTLVALRLLEEDEGHTEQATHLRRQAYRIDRRRADEIEEQLKDLRS
jgi:hypothetical protein